jgi:endonuclease IV
LRIGIHTSRAGSLEHAALKAEELGANTFQILTRQKNSWVDLGSGSLPSE